MTKRTRTQAAVEHLMKAQAERLRQNEIPPGMNVYADMDTAWRDLADKMHGHLSAKQTQDAKFIFYCGVQAAANLMIYCSGQSRFETAADQITRDCIAYETEAEAVQRQRQFEDLADEKIETPEATSH